MSSVVTLSGPVNLLGLGADEAKSGYIEDFTVSTVSWGVLAFAVGTVLTRGYRAIRRK